MKIFFLKFFAIVLLFGCDSGSNSKAELYWKNSLFNNLLISFDEKPILRRHETRLWIDYSMMEAAELYKIDQRKMYFKKWNDQADVATSDSITIAREVVKELYAVIDQINEIDSPSECDYCNKIGDGAAIIYESWHDGDLIIKERNLGELSYQDMILDSGLGDADELKLFFDLIEMLEKEKQATTKPSLKP